MDDGNEGKIASGGSVLSGIVFATAWYLFWGSLLLAHTDCILWREHPVMLGDNSSLAMAGEDSPFSLSRINCTDPARENPNPDGLYAPPGLRGGTYWVPGILSTLGMIGLNIVSWEAVSDQGGLGDGVAVFAKVWVTCSLILIFSGLAVSVWCLVTDMQPPDDGKPEWHVAGVCTFVSNLLIAFAGVLFRLVRRSGEHAI